MDDKRERTLAVVTRLLASARDRDLPALAACYAEHAVSISPQFGELHGREQIAARWQTLFETFVEVSINVADTMVDGDRVAVFARLVTIDRMGWFGRAPTGGPIDYRLVLIFTVSGDQVVRDERVYDSVGLMERLEKNRIDKELRTAREVQRALVPRTVRSTAFCEWIGDSVPCRAIGGDFFEFFELPSGSVGMMLGDVSGKGPAAALLAALVQGMFATEAATAEGPAALLASINRRLLSRQLESRFVTLVYAVLSPGGRLVYANAGHNPPIVLSGERTERLDASGTVLGVLDDAVFTERSVEMRPGDTLVMYTDGVTEAREKTGEEFGEDRLVEQLMRDAAMPPTALLDRVFQHVQSFSEGNEPSDDITVTVTRFR